MVTSKASDFQGVAAPTSRFSSDSNSNSSAVDTNNQPAKNSEGRVIEWITQYLRDG